MRQAAIQAGFSLVIILGPMMPRSTSAQLVTPPMGELMLRAKLRDEELQESRRQLAEAEFASAFATARLARAEGKRDLAASEWRKVIRHREAQLEDLKIPIARGRFCPSGPWLETTGPLAVARVWLADLEGRDDVLRAELPPAIKYFEWKIEYHTNLLKRFAIRREEADQIVNEAQGELRWVRERLAALPATPTSQPRWAGP